MSSRSLRRLERGERRTRASTLVRLAEAIDRDDPDLLPSLILAAGAALAPESVYRERVEARRRRRRAAAAKRIEVERVVTRRDTFEGILEERVTRRRLSRHRMTETTRVRLLPSPSDA